MNHHLCVFGYNMFCSFNEISKYPCYCTFSTLLSFTQFDIRPELTKRKIPLTLCFHKSQDDWTACTLSTLKPTKWLEEKRQWKPEEKATWERICKKTLIRRKIQMQIKQVQSMMNKCMCIFTGCIIIYSDPTLEYSRDVSLVQFPEKKYQWKCLASAQT